MILITDIFSADTNCNIERITNPLTESEFKNYCRDLVVDEIPENFNEWDEAVAKNEITFSEDCPGEFMCVIGEEANLRFREEGGFTVIKQFLFPNK